MSEPTERRFRIIRQEVVTRVLELTAEDMADRLEATMDANGLTVEQLTPQWLDDVVGGGGENVEDFEVSAVLEELYNSDDVDYADTETRVEEV